MDTSPHKTTHKSQRRGFTFVEVAVFAILGIIFVVVIFRGGRPFEPQGDGRPN